MTTAASTTTAPAPHHWLRLGLTVVATLETYDALAGIPNIFTDHQHANALLRFAQALTSIKLALAPVIAATALLYAAWGNLRRAILALAALVLLSWLLDDLWAIPIRGFEFSADLGGMVAFVHHVIIFPAAAIAGAVLTLKDRRLVLAGLLVSLPTLFNWIGLVIFIIGSSIHGS
jgi:hypothetical protein